MQYALGCSAGEDALAEKLGSCQVKTSGCKREVSSYTSFILQPIQYPSKHSASKERYFDVAATSLRRHDVAGTSKQRYFDAECLLGYSIKEGWSHLSLPVHILCI